MAMKPRFEIISGINYTYDSNGYYQAAKVDAVYDILNGIVTNKGNHKTPLPQSFTHTYETTGRGTHWFARGTYFWQTSGVQATPAGYQAAPSISASNVYNKALSRLHDQVRGKVDLSIDLAEAHKSASMVKKALKGIALAAHTFGKMRRSNPRDWGNLWLEFTYGWKPLASSIYGTIEEWNRPKHPFYTVVATASERDFTSGSTVFISPGVRRVYFSSLTRRCRIVSRYAIAQTELDRLSGYTSLNPVSIAWELMPYSFVVDWFLDVGGYVRNLESALLLCNSWIDGYVTEGSLLQQTVQVVGSNTMPFGPLTQTDYYNITATKRTTTKSRNVLTSAPFPRIPAVEAHLGSSRLISAASLLGQLLPGRK